MCFTPDTLGDYADAFAVQTQLGRFEVALRGSRPHPRLSLPDELQVRGMTRPACLQHAKDLLRVGQKICCCSGMLHVQMQAW